MGELTMQLREWARALRVSGNDDDAAILVAASTALTAATERAERAERQIAEMQAFARDWRDGTTALIDEADANAKHSESDLTAARALLREVEG